MYKILSVDDEPINQIIVEELLSSQFDVALLSSGEECLSQIEDIKPDLILMDVSMPGIDGYQTCRQLKTSQSSKHIPIVFVSARSTLEDKIKGYEAGGHDYITKPFNHAKLEGKINQLIQSVKATGADSEQSIANPAILAWHAARDSDIIKHLLDDIGLSQSPDEIGQAILTIGEQLQLECIIQLRHDSDHYNFSCSNGILPLELLLIEDTLEQEQFVEFNSHMIITLPQVSLLIKNMPTDDQNCYEDLKQLLGIMSSKIQAKMTALFN